MCTLPSIRALLDHCCWPCKAALGKHAMDSMGSLKGPSLRQHFRTVVVCTVLLQLLLQALSVAVTYLYFTSEMKQLRDKHSKSGTACFLMEDRDSTDKEILNRSCLQAKRQLYQLIEKVTLRTIEENFSTVQEKQLSVAPLPRDRRPQRVAAHITGISRRSTSALTPISKDGKTLGQKIESWESSRKGHSFLNQVLLRKGELVIQKQGLYYIYSQTYFRFQEAEEASQSVSKDRRNKQLVQYIYKYTNYPDPIILMKSARNSCWSKDAEYGLYSIYQGGLFELKENDRIFVSVTNEHLVDLDQEASFFGAFLIN